jgi:hypothetical protein
VACRDTLLNTSVSTSISFTIAAATDTTPAVISGLSPSGTVACAPNPYTPTITATTDEAATCRWGLSNVAYASLTNLFTTTGGTSHSGAFPISVACPSTQTVYVRCTNAAGLVNTTSTSATFTMGTPPTISLASISPASGSTLACPSEPVSATLSFLTNAAASCRYHPSSAQWADMTAMESTESVTHSQTISLSCGATYTYLFKCRDSGGDESGMSYTYFTVATTTVIPTNMRLQRGAEMLNGAEMR